MSSSLKRMKQNVAKLKFNAAEMDVMLNSARVKGRMEGIKYTLEKLAELGYEDVVEKLKTLS